MNTGPIPTEQKAGQKRNNQTRAAYIEQAIEDTYPSRTPAGALSRLLADARHFCDRKGLDFGELDRKAYKTYLEERAG